MSKNIVLIGFMGAGKSMASKELAKRLKRETVSTDTLIENKEGRVIADIFQGDGEAHFRQLEKAVVADIAQRENLIVDCGGGAFLDPENVERLKQNSLTVYLSATPEIIYERTKKSRHRPLLNVENPKKKIEELLDQRRPFYEQADYTIDTDHKTNDQVCNEIEEILSNE